MAKARSKAREKRKTSLRRGEVAWRGAKRIVRARGKRGVGGKRAKTRLQDAAAA